MLSRLRGWDCSFLETITFRWSGALSSAIPVV